MFGIENPNFGGDIWGSAFQERLDLVPWDVQRFPGKEGICGRWGSLEMALEGKLGPSLSLRVIKP